MFHTPTHIHTHAVCLPHSFLVSFPLPLSLCACVCGKCRCLWGQSGDFFSACLHAAVSRGVESSKIKGEARKRSRGSRGKAAEQAKELKQGREGGGEQFLSGATPGEFDKSNADQAEQETVHRELSKGAWQGVHPLNSCQWKYSKWKWKCWRLIRCDLHQPESPDNPSGFVRPAIPARLERERKEKGERGKKERVKVHDMTRQLTHDIRLVLHLRGGGERKAKGGDLSWLFAGKLHGPKLD